MNLDLILKDNSILIIPNNIKNKVLLKLNNLDNIYNIKILSLNEFISRLTFTYNEEAIYYLIKNYNIKYEVAKVYLDNIKYIDKDKRYNIKKLDKLSKIKRRLIDNNLLKYDVNFINYVSDKEVIIYGYDYISNYDRNVLSKLSNVRKLSKKHENYVHTIYEFSDIDNEVEFIANKIIKLINNKIDINNIKLAGISSEYLSVIKRIFGFYNIPVNLPNNSSIYDTSIISDFIKLINENDINISLDLLEKKYDLLNEENNYIYNKLVDILNKYTFIDNYLDVIDMLIYDFKHTENYNNKKINSIEIINLKDNIIDDNIYVFLLGFNQGNIPAIYKDEDYITDFIRPNLDIETTQELNDIEKINIISIIKSIKNLVITYKLKTPFDIYYKSIIIDELGYDVIINEKIENKYSNKMNNIHLADCLDNLIKYGIKDDNLGRLYNSYSDIKYLTFDNKFSGIKKNDLLEYLDKKLLLSYSSVDNYYRCSFRYYLNNILKLTEYESTFAIEIGNIFHYILSKCFDDDFIFDKEFNIAISDLELNPSDKFFLKKLKNELLFIIDTIKLQNKFSSFDKALYESKVYINKEGNIKLTFMGIIDKLLYKKENNKTYLAIIDYKTGNPHTNLNNTIYGIDMQLPVYLYLSNNMSEIKNAEVVGFYLQKILNNEIIKSQDKIYEKQKKDNLKLQGYSINDEEILEKFDSSYKDSEVIKSMKVGNNGFYAYSKTISKDEINKLIEITEKNINDAFKNILDAKFDINPKRIGKNNVGCEFCKYKDICYMKEEDIVNLEEYKDLEFLKGV
ncbi:MAG: PD-(D/E)XK nuclease family protein [Bacilli bacterium]|nr:PD-(D/E)XK nuclease family protein [Bacilli bacterium]